MQKYPSIYVYIYINSVYIQTPPCFSEGGTYEAKHPRNSLQQTTRVYLNILGAVLTLPYTSIAIRKQSENHGTWY